MKDQECHEISEAAIYLELDSETRKVLADNDLSIEDLLEKNEIEARVIFGILPFYENGARSKDLVPIILASSIAIASIGYAISNVLNSLSNMSHFVQYYENVELRDPKGNVLFNKEGKPLFKQVLKNEIHQPRTSQEEQYQANFDLTNGLIVKFNSKIEQ
jgi:hypothetical protein